MKENPLPHDGRWHRATTRKFSETIVFTSHFGGHRSSSKRHQDLVNELGFDCVTFHLDFKFTSGLKKSLIEVWAEQLNDVLEKIDGPKIIYSFSSPSAATARLLAKNQRTDVKAWICDGGPFLDAVPSLVRYFQFQTKLPLPARWLVAPFSYYLIGGFTYEKDVRCWMNKLSPQFPILSIRAGKDQLVPKASIQKFFATNPGLNLNVLELPEAEHLEGLKNFPELYKSGISKFLLIDVPRR